jgi:hypothetical protein
MTQQHTGTGDMSHEKNQEYVILNNTSTSTSNMISTESPAYICQCPCRHMSR